MGPGNGSLLNRRRIATGKAAGYRALHLPHRLEAAKLPQQLGILSN